MDELKITSPEPEKTQGTENATFQVTTSPAVETKPAEPAPVIPAAETPAVETATSPAPIAPAEAPAATSTTETSQSLKTPQEIALESAKKSFLKKILIITALVIVIVAAVLVYFFGGSGQKLQGDLSNVAQDAAALNFCPINQYIPLNERGDKAIFAETACLTIMTNDTALVAEIKKDPVKYYVNPDTLKQEWWQNSTDATSIEATSVNTTSSTTASETTGVDATTKESTTIESTTTDKEATTIESNTDATEKTSMETGTNTTDATEVAGLNETNDKTATTITAENSCESLLAATDANIAAGDVNKAYDKYLMYVTSDQCNPTYNQCSERMGSAVAAKSLLDYAETLGKRSDYLMEQYKSNESAYYRDANCINVQAVCAKKTAPTANSLPLDLLSDTAGKLTSATLNINVSKAIETQNMYTEQEFYNKYCKTQTTELQKVSRRVRR